MPYLEEEVVLEDEDAEGEPAPVAGVIVDEGGEAEGLQPVHPHRRPHRVAEVEDRPPVVAEQEPEEPPEEHVEITGNLVNVVADLTADSTTSKSLAALEPVQLRTQQNLVSRMMHLTLYHQKG
jgi:hypothetical protein